jgi:cobalt-zinc-cadmium efflux system membrane fusion protein
MTTLLRLARRARVSLFLGLACAAGLGLACASCSGTKAQPVENGGSSELNLPKPGQANSQISVAPVEEHEVGKTVISTARVTFDDLKVAHVFSPVTGRVANIAAQLGDKVRKGQTLATIVSPDLGMAMADVNKAKADVTAAEHELKRQKELVAAHAGAGRDLEAAEDNYMKSKAELERADEKRKLLMATPIDGEVVARSINPGVEVQGQYTGGTTLELFTIGRLDTVWVMCDVYEQDIGRVKMNAPVTIKLIAYPDKEFVGKVDWISGTLDPATRTAKVRVSLPNADRLLKPEMYATAQIEAEGHKTVAIPRSSVLHLGDKTVVIAVDGTKGRYERRPVIVDEDETGDWVPVSHGLDQGDKIVTAGALLLSELVN